MENKKPLLSIRNLKQYFPVKGKKGVYVKANDGISLEIYENEILGVVGESGCGKSTLGRVLLQLYQQTDGETIYYGRTMDSVAPKYALDIYKSLEKRIAEVKVALKKADEVEAEFAKLESTLQGKELFAKLDEKNKVRRDADLEYKAIVRLVGGFYVAKDLREVSTALISYYLVTKEIKKVNQELTTLQMHLEALEFDKKEGKNVDSKLSTVKAKMAAAKDGRLVSLEKDLKAKTDAVDALRAKYADDPEFQRFEEMRDTGIDLARLKYDEMRFLRRDLQMIFQDPYSSLNSRLTVGQIIAEGPLTHEFFTGKGDQMQEYSMKLMEDCGLAPYMIHRYPHQFSGGQRQRIGIARALSVKPKFVVCDEAVSALDVSIQSQIINLLQELKEKENLTYMFISHDLSVIKYISDRVAVMYLGNIVELTSSVKLFEKPLHPYTEALLTAIPTTDVDAKKEMIVLEGDIPSPVNPPKGCKFHTRCPYVMDICKQVTPELVELEPEHFVACHKYTQES